MTKPKKKRTSRGASAKVDVALLRDEYASLTPVLTRFSTSLTVQLQELLKRNDLPLGVPIEQRVKTWDSVADKIERKGAALTTVRALPDLVGLRLIFLFSRHSSQVQKLIDETFTVIEKEDKIDALSEDHFGYQSVHYVVAVKPEWVNVPSFFGCDGLRAEIQVRTLAQHIWAAASHVLQYKREGSVPQPVRRSIHRVSALLETIDLEFERVLDQRDSYVSEIPGLNDNASLDVDVLRAICNEMLPEKNRSERHEGYAEVLAELRNLDIVTTGQLRQLLNEQAEFIIAKEKKAVQDKIIGDGPDDRKRGDVFYFHTGFCRNALKGRFGDNYEPPISIGAG